MQHSRGKAEAQNRKRAVGGIWLMQAIGPIQDRASEYSIVNGDLVSSGIQCPVSDGWYVQGRGQKRPVVMVRGKNEGQRSTGKEQWGQARVIVI